VDWIPLSIAFVLTAAVFAARRPVEASLGMYAFLVPFDAVLIGDRRGISISMLHGSSQSQGAASSRRSVCWDGVLYAHPRLPSG